MASSYGYLDAVRTLLQGGADVNAQSNVRNQMMILLTINYLDDDDDDCY